MFKNWKRSACRTLAIGAVAIGLTGGMAFQQAAPAEAVLPLLLIAPIAGAAGGTGITAGGAAAAGLFIAALGAAVALTDPEKREAAVDWWMEPVDIFGRPLDENGAEKDDAKEIAPPENLIAACYTSACGGTPWISKFLSYRTEQFYTKPEVPAGCAPANCTTQRSVVIALRQKAQQTHRFTPVPVNVKVRYSCRVGSGAVVHKEQVSSIVSYGLQTGTTDYDFTGGFNCEKADGQIQEVMLSPATRDEVKATGASVPGGWTDSTDPVYSGAPNGTVSYVATGGASGTDKKYVTKITCQAPDGTKTVIESQTPIGEGGLNVPSCAAAGLGKLLDGTVTVNDGLAVKQDLLTLKDDGSCTDPNGCKLQVFVDGKACVVGSAACASWAGLSVSNPSRVQCVYGAAVVPMERCGYLEGAYIWGGTPAIRTNTDGNPATWTDPATVTGWQPHSVTDAGPRPAPNMIPGPAPTAQPQPDISNEPGSQPQPQPSPSPSPSPSSSPGTGGQPNTGTETGGFPGTGSNPSSPATKDCMDDAWGWNPVDWVAVPIGCALDYAFVPKKSVETRVQTMSDQLSGKVPLTWFGVGMDPVSGGGCPTSWAVEVQGERYSLICGTAADSIIRGFRPVMGAMLVVAAMWPLVRSLFYASIPIFKVTPS